MESENEDVSARFYQKINEKSKRKKKGMRD